MTDQNTDALMCADALEAFVEAGVYRTHSAPGEAAAHIRRLVAENEDLRCKLDDAEENVFGLGLVAQGHIELLEKRNADLAAMRQALEAGKELHRYYAHIWDRVDGCAVIFPESIPGFEAAVETHAAAIAALKERVGDE